MSPRDASFPRKCHPREGNFFPWEGVPLGMFSFGETLTSRNVDFFPNDRSPSKTYLFKKMLFPKKGNFVPRDKFHHEKMSPKGRHSR
jgi:hypothetical protein